MTIIREDYSQIHLSSESPYKSRALVALAKLVLANSHFDPKRSARSPPACSMVYTIRMASKGY